ncbi:MAG: glycosyltransferase family 2 protein [Thermosphaera sp.]
MNIALIIPTLNEREGLEPTILEYKSVLKNVSILVVDGGSEDGTVDIARKLGTEVLLVGEKGKGRAIAAGLEYLRNNHEPDIVVFTDGDYTYPANKLPEMIRILENRPNVGAVIGNRLSNMPKKAFLTDAYLLGNLVIRRVYKTLRNIDLRDPLSGLRAVRWEAIREWKPVSRGFEIETEMNLYLFYRGWKIEEVPINYRKRIGRKKLRISDAIPILLMLKDYNTNHAYSNSHRGL